MNRQINLQKEVEAFDASTIEQRIKNTLEAFCQDYEKFSVCNISITNTDLPIDRKLLYSWRQHELLPFEKQKGKNWGKFSFIEICWLKLLLELRSVGIGIDKLKEIKSFFFPENYIDDFVTHQLADLTNLPAELADKLNSKGIIKNGIIQLTPYLHQIFEDIQFSHFTLFLQTTIMTRSNYILVIDAEKHVEVLDLNYLMNNSSTELPKIYDKLSDSTCVFVNIRKIVTDISGTEEIFRKTPTIATVISEKSISVLKQLFSDNRVKEVTIRVNKNGQPTVLVKKEMELAELQKQIHTLNKKGTFKDIIVKTRDGNVQYFEQTEILKL